jgi:hypothetical protein
MHACVCNRHQPPHQPTPRWLENRQAAGGEVRGNSQRVWAAVVVEVELIYFEIGAGEAAGSCVPRESVHAVNCRSAQRWASMDAVE